MVAELAPWRAVRVLECSHNCVADMDASLRLLPALRSLTLTHSNLSEVANLEACTGVTRCRLPQRRARGCAPAPSLSHLHAGRATSRLDSQPISVSGCQGESVKVQ